MPMEVPANHPSRGHNTRPLGRRARRLAVLGQIVLTLVIWLVASAAARADMALVVSSHERTAELTHSLEIALRGYGVLVAYKPMGDARSPLERAALAQRVARNVGARVAFWIEPGPPARVRAVSAGESDEHIVEAPLPTSLEQIHPRAFGQIAASVILEALGVERRNLPMAQSAEYMVPMPPWEAPNASPWYKFGQVRTHRVRRPRRVRRAMRRGRVHRAPVHE
jgi:hypothetical protein